MFGVEVVFKNGKRDWVDPCEVEPVLEGNILNVTNECHTYTYDIDKVERWFNYELCPECLSDLRTYGCNDEDCESPYHTP